MKKDAEKRLRHFDSWNTKLTLNIEYFKLTMKKKELVFFCHFFLFITWCQCMYKPVKIYQPRKFVKWLQFAILPELVFVRFALVRRCFGTSYLAGQGNVYSHWKLHKFFTDLFIFVTTRCSKYSVWRKVYFRKQIDQEMEYQRLIDNQDDRGIHFVYFIHNEITLFICCKISWWYNVSISW